MTPGELDLLRRLRVAGILVPPPAPAVPVTDLSVVIPARAPAGPVNRVLASIPSHVPVVLVDDGSPTPLSGAARHPNVRTLRHELSLGPAAARNRVAAGVTTTWTLFVDADVQPPADWVSRLLACVDDDVVAVAPRIRSAQGSGIAGWFERSSPSLDLGPDPADVRPGSPVPYVPSAALLVRSEAFRQCDGFDEDMHLGEDVDLVWRLLQHGRVRYEPAVIVDHATRPNLLTALNRRRQYGTSAGALSRRHPDSLRHVEVSIWSFAPWAVGLLGHPWAGAAVAGTAVLAAPRGMTALRPAHARRLAGTGQLQAFIALGRWLRRPLLPATAVVALVAPPLRRRLAAALLLGFADIVWESISEGGRGPHPARAASRGLSRIVAGALDDAAYSLGVWQGMLHHRSAGPALPRVRGAPTATSIRTWLQGIRRSIFHAAPASCQRRQGPQG